jgi:hypothetical protein
MKRYKTLIILKLIFIIQIAFAQTTEKIKTDEFRFGIGSVSYRNALYIPSGLPGINYSITYNATKEYQTKQFEFKANASYSHLMNDRISVSTNQFYNCFEIKMGAIWSREIPAPFSHLKWYVGLGENFNGNFFNSPIENLYPFGGWHMTSDFTWKMKMDIKTITLQAKISIPFIVFGHFDKYQDTPLTNYYEEHIKEYLTPNAIATINNYFDFDADISILYHLKSNNNISLKCSYEFDRLRSNIYENLVLSQLQMFSVGIIIKK